MQKFNQLPQAIQEAFIQLSLRLEPERLYQDGERDHMEAQEEANKIFKEWATLEKDHNTSISLDEVEKAAWNS